MKGARGKPVAATGQHRLWWYLALSFGFSWAWWVPMAVAGEVSQAGQGWPTHLVGLAGPALAAVAVTAWYDGRPGLLDLWRRATRWRVGASWWLLVVATAALSGLGFLAGWWRGDAVPMGDLGLYSGAPAAGTLASLLLVLAYVLLVNGFGEELGWRGWLAHHLLPRLGRLRAASVVWLVWAVWHAPLFLVVENFRAFGIGTTLGWLVGLWFGSYFLTWLYQSTGGSVLLVACWHTAYNLTTATEATAGLPAAVASTLVMVVTAVVLLRSRRAGDRVPAPTAGRPQG